MNEENIQTFIRKKFQKFSQRQDEESDNTSHNMNSSLKNINGFAFSLGSKILKRNSHDNQIRNINNKRNTLKIKPSLFHKEKDGKDTLSKTNTPKIKKRKLSIRNEKLKFDKFLIFFNQRSGSINTIKSKINLKENKKEILEIYKKSDDNHESEIINKLKEVKKCSILKYGIKPSTEDIYYSYCLKCDSSLINPICIPCLNHCHKGHAIKEKYEVGKIICSCGERSHIILNEENSNYIENRNICLCNEWSKTSNLNFCYKKSNTNDNICFFCFNFCVTDKNKYSVKFFDLKEMEDLPQCICKNKNVHNEFRLLLNSLEKMSKNYKIYEGIKLLHPTQIINAFIKSKKSFEYNCNSFCTLFNAIKNNSFDNSLIHYSLSKFGFYTSNCFLIMKTLLNIINFNYHSNTSYYSEEVENYFSFEIIQNLIDNIKKSNLKENSKWILSCNYLKLFKKIYIGNKTQIFSKFKIEDLDNFSSCQRFSLFYKDENLFPQCENIISFFIQYIQEINIKGFTCVEVIPCVEQIFGILKKFAFFNMISNGNIIRVLKEIEKFFINLNILRNLTKITDNNYEHYTMYKTNIIKKKEDKDTNINNNSNIIKNLYSHNSDSYNESEILETYDANLNEDSFFEEEFPFYYTIIKLLRIFYFNYNDRLIHNIINDNIKYPNNNNFFNNHNISFGYMKNDFGREMFKVTIKILYIIYKHKKDTEKKKSIYQKILYHGIKILEYSIMKKDSYIISIIRSFINGEFYEKKYNLLFKEHSNNNETISINKYLKELNLLTQEKNNLDKCNKKFLNFEINNEELITNYKKSLDNILNTQFKDDKIIGFKEDIIISILKTKYFYILSKIYRILYFSNEIISNEKNIKEKIISKIYTKEKISKQNQLIDELTPKIIFFYKNFIFHSSENSLLVLSHYIFNDLTKIPIRFGLDNFLLFHTCLENIAENNIENIINNSVHYLKNLYKYLIYLHEKEYKKINDCLLIFLKCFYIIAINIRTVDYEILIKSIRQILIDINIIFKIAKNYFKLDEEGVSEILRKIEKENKSEVNEIKNENNNETISNNINKGFNENISINNSNQNNGNKKININNLEECFIIDLQLINDFFDFAISEQKEKITKLIDVHKIIYCLKFHNIIHLALRTQMIRFVRKILIDMNYNKDSNYIYINSIINNEDNLSILKINPLVHNYKYPTKLFSYTKDFWNVSINSEVYQNIVKINDKIDIDNFVIKNEIEENEENEKKEIFSSSSNKSNENETNKVKNSKIKEIKPDEEITSKNFLNSYINKKEDYHHKDNIKCFDTNIYDLLINEIQNVNDIISDINTSSNDEMQSLGEYFQNGLLIPIIFFLKKSFAVAHNLNGTELVKLYDLVVQTINLKIVISEFKYNFWDDKNINNNDSNFNDDLLSTHILNNRKDYLINGNIFIEGEMVKKTSKILNILKNKNFSCFDYTLLYNIVEKNLFNLLNEYSQNYIGELFSEKEDDINMQLMNNPFSQKNNNNSDINEKLYKIYLFYKNRKNSISDENNSSLFNILPEICIEYETNYRNLLIFFLISNGNKLNINKKNNSYSISLYYLLYRLLSLETSKTQTEIINLLGGLNNNNDNLGFISNYSQHLLKRIILFFIDIFNPKDKYYNDNYLFTINLIKIFKFLCEEHNNFFQMRLIKTLNYQYKNIIPFFYNENKTLEEYQSQYANNTEDSFNIKYKEDNIKIKKVKFFDFFLHTLIKIAIVSGWEKLQKPNSNSLKKKEHLNSYNENVYDLFSSIIEMLNEIIQGNKEEYLSRIGNPFLKEEEGNCSSEEENEYNDLISIEINYLNGARDIGEKKEKLEDYQIKKKMYKKLIIQKDPFTCFLKGMIKYIFIDNNDSQILYQLRNDLMVFFTSILEEKYCNKEVQKLIIKYINIHRVFNSMSSILKNYFISNAPLDSLPEDFFPPKSEKNNDLNLLTIDNFLSKKNYSSIDNREKENINENKNNNKNNYNEHYSNINNKKININELREKLIFDHRLLNYYYENYYSNKEFFLSNEFQLTNVFYKYIKLIAVLGKNEEIRNIIEEAEYTSIEAAIKKFEPNILNIKKESIKFFNHKDIKNQIQLSKSLRKNTQNESRKYRKSFIDTFKNKKSYTNITSVQLKTKNRKSKDFFHSSVYSNAKLVNQLSLIQKGVNNNEIFNSHIDFSKKNLMKYNNFDNSESSERVLEIDKKDNESSMNKLQVNNNNNNINNNNENILKYNKISRNKINNNKRIKFADNNIINNKEKNENNENTMSTKININSSVNKLNDLNKTKKFEQKAQKKRFSTFFQIDKKEAKYSLIPDNTKEYYDKDYIERFYIVKFFESITSTIEVRNEESKNQTVIFTHLPEMIYLSNGTKVQFEQKVNRQSEITKKNDLIRNIEYFHKEIEYFKNNFSSISHWASKFDFAYLKWASYIYALILNLLALFTISGDEILSAIYDDEYEIIKMRRNDKIGIETKINFSINSWELTYDVFNYIYLFLNGILIILWLYFRLPLYYELDKIKYFEENIHKKDLIIRDKLYIIIVMSIYNRNSISSLIYLFLVSLICSILKRGQLFFPFLLLAIVDLNETLKNVILSIKLRYKEFFLCFFLAFIFMYGLSNIAFFYFNTDFEQELDYHDDNVCKSLVFCVLNAIDSGLRARGGIGDSGKRISYMRGQTHYIKRLILDDIFFFLIVIISIDLVFGIIIGEFAALREETQNNENDRKYHCFICHANKNNIEKNRQNFSIHINKVHNLWNYVSYMIFVKLNNIHDLNSINSYAREKIDNKDISWIPSYKDLINDDKNEGKENKEDEIFRIEDENINNHYVVKPT